jgi:FAD dependent oxidoreductase
LHNSDGLHYLPYKIDEFKKLAEEFLSANKVRILYNAVLKTVQVADGRIISISVIAAGNPVTIQLNSLIDCSGESIVSRLAGLPVIKSKQYQAAAQVFTLKGVEEENEARLGMILMKSLHKAIAEDKLADFYDRVYIVQGSLQNKCVSLQELKTVAHSFVNNLTEFLRTHVPAFRDASIDHIASEVGTRIGQRGLGKYTLTEDDVLACRKFDDAIANSAWPIEEWGQQRRVMMRYFNTNDFYQVPARCLQSLHISNLFFAGRNISATDSAIASARVMGICLQTGYAAGAMAAASATGSALCNVIKELQNDQL